MSPQQGKAMSRTQQAIMKAILKEMEAKGVTRYAIYKATGVDQGQLANVAKGKVRLGWEALDKILDHLGLKIVIRPKRKGR